ncbi:MAG: RHS repeat-associated core domain-containing protein [Chitinophagaceae bacterium]
MDYYLPQVLTANDYYPFGMGMPGRKFAEDDLYRYGFNGKENDNDVKGEGNQQDYGMRIYDPRLGKFLSVDPLTYSFPWYTPYQFAGNTPVANIDLDGGEPKPAGKGSYNGQKEKTKEILPSSHVPSSAYCAECPDGDPSNGIQREHTWYWYSGDLNRAAKADWYSKGDYDLIVQDWEHGQVMLPDAGYPIKKFTPLQVQLDDHKIFGSGGRDWNGWLVDEKGYLTGQPFYEAKVDITDLFQWGGVAKKAPKLLDLAKAGRQLLKEGKYVLYFGFKESKLYIGKTEELLKRYSADAIDDLNATIFKVFQNNPNLRMPNNGIAIGVEQAVIKLNNAGENITKANRGIRLANKINAAVKDVYVKEGEKWLNDNIPNWRNVFLIKK